MNLKSLRKLLVFGLVAAAGYCWGNPSMPINDTDKWQDISNIQWSTDGGANWGTSALVVGQNVQFKVTVHKDYVGNHYADFVKAWIDLDGNQTFSDNEAMLFGYKVANSVANKNTVGDRLSGDSFSVVSDSSFVVGTDTKSSDFWVLARVTCSESLLAVSGTGKVWGNQWDTNTATTTAPDYRSYFSPTAHLVQGESELVKLTVNNKVPEPGTLALVAVAMLGMGWRRRSAHSG